MESVIPDLPWGTGGLTEQGDKDTDRLDTDVGTDQPGALLFRKRGPEVPSRKANTYTEQESV